MSATTETNARLQTQYTEINVTCPACRAHWEPVVANVVNVGTDPQGREGILRKSMHRPYCPRCKRILEVDHIFSYYDPEQKLLVQIRPKWEFNAGGGEEVYWKRLEDLVLKHAEDDIRVDVVFGYDEMIEKHLGGQTAAEAARARADAEREAGVAPGSILPDTPRTADATEADNPDGTATA